MTRRSIEPRTIYFVRGLTTGRTKIGCAWHVHSRLTGLSRTDEPVELLAVMPGCFADERALHQRFAALHEGPGREWFRDDGSIAALIATLPADQRGSRIYRPGPSRGRRGVRCVRTVETINAERAASARRYFDSHPCLRGEATAETCPGCRRGAAYRKSEETREKRMRPIYTLDRVNPFRAAEARAALSQKAGS